MQSITRVHLMDYHAGRATPLQARLIEEWLQQPENRTLFYETLHAWESQQLQYVADTETALERYQLFMQQGNQPMEARPVSRRLWSWKPWFAAAGVLLLCSGWLFRDTLQYKTYQTEYSQVLPVELPDGSHVTLNANSTLKYPRFDFGNGPRNVILNGEARFSVVHTKDHRRFVVKTDRNLDVEVLGTEFVVFNRERGTRVVLMQGKVQLNFQKQGRTLTMKPGDQVTLTPVGSFALTKQPKPEEVAAWTQHRYVFADTKLSEIAQLMKENYGYEVKIPNQNLAQRMVSGTFNAKDGNELLNALQLVLNLNVERVGKRITLTEKN
ncbi:iron dicitrate transport regulator FecR [Siphonobacter sp. BAB-5405]|uniref:FecR family protein n=1 Tax=Siphonobacter sp. BAB-5405 TaxID=1864825 RepID=UPI000C804420|nr:FecR domain-containing protein [Siphonobacter sp. BAB-5405]PMD99248.1 iron dicitrate transport regulator FecR [Siphonobacter sp. BAB-5405]